MTSEVYDRQIKKKSCRLKDDEEIDPIMKRNDEMIMGMDVCGG